VKSAYERTKQAQQKFSAILDSVGKIASTAEGFAASAEELSASTEELNAAVDNAVEQSELLPSRCVSSVAP